MTALNLITQSLLIPCTIGLQVSFRSLIKRPTVFNSVQLASARAVSLFRKAACIYAQYKYPCLWLMHIQMNYINSIQSAYHHRWTAIIISEYTPDDGEHLTMLQTSSPVSMQIAQLQKCVSHNSSSSELKATLTILISEPIVNIFIFQSRSLFRRQFFNIIRASEIRCFTSQTIVVHRRTDLSILRQAITPSGQVSSHLLWPLTRQALTVTV